jgi:hypothetical protein
MCVCVFLFIFIFYNASLGSVRPAKVRLPRLVGRGGEPALAWAALGPQVTRKEAAVR